MDGELKFCLVQTELGWIGLVLSPEGIRATTLPKQARDEALHLALDLGASGAARQEQLGELPRTIQALASGGDADLNAVRLDWRGITPFRRAVLEETGRIPPGETRSYGWLAAKVGRPKAARAVGQVMATNPFPIVIPCHRVLAGGRKIGGYGGGLEMKEKLLRAEGALQ